MFPRPCQYMYTLCNELLWPSESVFLPCYSQLMALFLCPSLQYALWCLLTNGMLLFAVISVANIIRIMILHVYTAVLLIIELMRTRRYYPRGFSTSVLSLLSVLFV